MPGKAEPAPGGRRDLLVAVLMAGRAERFGGGKLDADCLGRPLGSWAVDTALSLGDPVSAVVAPEAPVWLDPQVAAVINPDPSAGLGGSVALAAQAAVAAGAGQVLILLGDMPLIGRDTLLRLIELSRQHGMAATLHADGKRGVPACFAAGHFAALAALTGDGGARALLLTCDEAALVTPSPDELLDVDCQPDLAPVAAALAARRGQESAWARPSTADR